MEENEIKYTEALANLDILKKKLFQIRYDLALNKYEKDKEKSKTIQEQLEKEMKDTITKIKRIKVIIKEYEYEEEKKEGLKK